MSSSKPLPIILAHIVVILLAYSSPLWLNWRLIALGIALYYLQLALFGGCVLSLAQFKGEKISFHEWYLTKWGVRVNRKKLSFFLNRVLPFIILGLAILIQVPFRYVPLLSA